MPSNIKLISMRKTSIQNITNLDCLTLLQVGAVQHSIVKPTSDKINEQRDAIVEKVTKIVEAAAASGVNVLCFQEAWSK